MDEKEPTPWATAASREEAEERAEALLKAHGSISQEEAEQRVREIAADLEQKLTELVTLPRPELLTPEEVAALRVAAEHEKNSSDPAALSRAYEKLGNLRHEGRGPDGS